MDLQRILLAGAGFLADAYDLFVINVVVDMMSKCDYHQNLTNELKSNVKTTALIGAIVGQIFFGASADLIGRRKVFIATCTLVILGALLSATVMDTANTSFGIYSQLCLWRFLLGVGVGGEYPLSAAVTSESCSHENKLKSLAMVFSMQGFGTLLCAIVLVLLSQTLGDNYDMMWRIALGIGGVPMLLAFYFRWMMHESKSWEKQNNVQQSSKDQHLPQHNLDTITHLTKTTNTSALTKLSNSVGYISTGLKYTVNVVALNKWALLGTAGSWFILDIVFYANGLFSGQITQTMGFHLSGDVVNVNSGSDSRYMPSSSSSSSSSIKSEALAQLILQALALPGYICTIFFIDSKYLTMANTIDCCDCFSGNRRNSIHDTTTNTITTITTTTTTTTTTPTSTTTHQNNTSGSIHTISGPSSLQKIGFLMTALFFFNLAIFQPFLIQVPLLYIVLYGFTFFFQNFGGNATTYIIPSIIYPTQYKATCHGISAACGKLGAIVGAETLLYVSNCFCPHFDCRQSDTSTVTNEDIHNGLRVTFAVCGVLSIIGYVWTCLFVNNAQAYVDDDNDASSSSSSSEIKVSLPTAIIIHDDADDDDDDDPTMYNPVNNPIIRSHNNNNNTNGYDKLHTMDDQNHENSESKNNDDDDDDREVLMLIPVLKVAKQTESMLDNQISSSSSSSSSSQVPLRMSTSSSSSSGGGSGDYLQLRAAIRADVVKTRGSVRGSAINVVSTSVTLMSESEADSLRNPLLP